MARKLGPAHPRGTTWNGAGGWLMVWQSRHETFSRTVWMTFHTRGTTSSVSVKSSPSFDKRESPQAGHEHGAGMTTRSRGICSRNGFLTGRLRSNGATLVVLAAATSARRPSSLASASIFEMKLHLLEQATAALGARAVLLAPKPGDLQLEMRDNRLNGALAGDRTGRPRLGLVGTLQGSGEQRLERSNIVRKRRNSRCHEGE